VRRAWRVGRDGLFRGKRLLVPKIQSLSKKRI
jgi:hypothetical protein